MRVETPDGWHYLGILYYLDADDRVVVLSVVVVRYVDVIPLLLRLAK